MNFPNLREFYWTARVGTVSWNQLDRLFFLLRNMPLLETMKLSVSLPSRNSQPFGQAHNADPLIILPKLQTLTIVTVGDSFVDSAANVLSHLSISQAKVNLACITMYPRPSLDVSHIRYLKSVTNFRLSIPYGRYPSRMSTMLSVLRSMPLLETLELLGCIPGRDTGLGADQTSSHILDACSVIVLQHLQNLQISGRTLDTATSFLSHLSIPKAKKISLNFESLCFNNADKSSIIAIPFVGFDQASQMLDPCGDF